MITNFFVSRFKPNWINEELNGFELYYLFIEFIFFNKSMIWKTIWNSSILFKSFKVNLKDTEWSFWKKWSFRGTTSPFNLISTIKLFSSRCFSTRAWYGKLFETHLYYLNHSNSIWKIQNGHFEKVGLFGKDSTL